MIAFCAGAVVMAARDYIVMPVGNKSDFLGVGCIFSRMGGGVPRPLGAPGADPADPGCAGRYLLRMWLYNWLAYRLRMWSIGWGTAAVLPGGGCIGTDIFKLSVPISGHE